MLAVREFLKKKVKTDDKTFHLPFSAYGNIDLAQLYIIHHQIKIDLFYDWKILQFEFLFLFVTSMVYI